ncbi:hypothetical protein C3489_06835 [Streptomyces sp. Ru71]|nr:hypothetical protein C3489_06835 [Streptomyces sp. Ru71]
MSARSGRHRRQPPCRGQWAGPRTDTPHPGADSRTGRRRNARHDATATGRRRHIGARGTARPATTQQQQAAAGIPGARGTARPATTQQQQAAAG